MRYGNIILLQLLFIIPVTIIAQQQLFTTYATNEGLVHNSVRDIFQDSKGFIWIGTWEGLSKYDGHKFTNYTTADGLSQGMINNIFESKDGYVYVACNDGSLNRIKDNTEPAKFYSSKVVINRLKKLPNNKIVAVTDYNGLYEFADGKLSKPNQVHPNENYYNVSAFNDSLLIVQSDHSVELLNVRYELIAEQRVSSILFAESGLLTDSKKRTWLGTQRGLKLLSPSQEKGQPLRFLDLPAAFNLPLLRNNAIRDILEDDAGNIWIGTYYGLVRIGADGSQRIITEKEGLPSLDVSCIFQDRERNIWIGGSRGIAKLVTKTNIRIYTIENGLLSNNIASLLPFNNGNILVRSEKGLQLYDRTKETFLATPVHKRYYSGSDATSSLFMETEETPELTFVVFSQKKTDPYFFSPPSPGSNYALKDDKGNYFAPSSKGVWFSHDFINWQGALFYYHNKALLIDSKKNLWVGSLDSGLFRVRYDYVNDTPRLITIDHFLPGTGIRSLYEDSKGYIWAGSRYNGIFRFDRDTPKNSTVLHIDQSAGLTSNRVSSIGEDKTGCMWINFYNGLDKMIPGKDGYRIFNFSRVNNFFTNIQSMIFDNQHSLWLATTQGLVNISDGEMENMKPLRVYITAVALDDSVYRNYDYRNIELKYRHKQVQFEFAAPGFINEKQVQFSYRLLGSNNTSWSETSNQHTVSYANLQPGNYRFEVRNKGWNGEWGDAAGFEFVILPPFWQTWWFIAFVILIAAVVIYWLVKRRIKTIRKESRLKQKIVETEMMALRAQMNPHFIFNCLSAIDNLVQTNQKAKATTYLARFAKLIRSVLDSSKNNVVPFQNDYQSLQLYLQMEQFRCNDKFSYEITADEELLQADYKLPPLIVQPFVENAIHHGLLNKQQGDRKLSVAATLENDHIKYTVTDNGVGRAKAAQINELNKPGHKSYGLAITADRIHLYNQNTKSNDIIITDLAENGQPAGTRVEIYLKIDDNK